ncbi:MAG: peptide deformylase [Rhodobacteraceae bacterium]|nr:peptide deformylase [Paracoccaceae bacterium]
MAILPILTWPDPRLSTPCHPIGDIDEGLRKLAQDMLDTMYDAPGRGLAAPQVGVLTRLFVMDVDWKEGPAAPVVMVNPVIDWASDEEITREEGCLSIPGVRAEVSRPERVRMRWTTLEGEEVTRELDGFAATCAQHELDHLDGRVTFDRVDAAQRAALEAAYAEALA